MKYRFVVLMVLACLHLASADVPMRWNKGSVVDKNGEVRIGEIAIQTSNLILFKADNQITVYTPFHLRSFFYFDQQIKTNRKYSVQKMDDRNSSFYEIVLWGQIQMVRSPRAKGILNHRIEDKNDYNYYVLWNDSFVKAEDFMEEVYPSLTQSLDSFDTHSQELKLTTSYIDNVFELVKLYNKLSIQQGGVVASN